MLVYVALTGCWCVGVGVWVLLRRWICVGATVGVGVLSAVRVVLLGRQVAVMSLGSASWEASGTHTPHPVQVGYT